MNFDYNEEQQLLADSVRRFLQKDYDFEARRKILASPEGWSERVWSTFAEMGLTGLPLSPDYGGFGGGAVDLMSVMEAFGEALVVEPLSADGAWRAAHLPRAAMNKQKKADPAARSRRAKMRLALATRRARRHRRADGGQDGFRTQGARILVGQSRACEILTARWTISPRRTFALDKGRACEREPGDARGSAGLRRRARAAPKPSAR